MNQRTKEMLGKIKGVPVPKAVDMEPEGIKGTKPHVSLDSGRSTESAFRKGKIS